MREFPNIAYIKTLNIFSNNIGLPETPVSYFYKSSVPLLNFTLVRFNNKISKISNF